MWERNHTSSRLVKTLAARWKLGQLRAVVGAVEPRTISAGCRRTSVGRARSAPRPGAGAGARPVRPISTVGCATAVMRGSTIVIHGTSSNATSETSRGSVRRRRRSTCHACSASRLFAAKIAVGCSASSSASIRCSASGAWKPIGRISRSSTASAGILVREPVAAAAARRRSSSRCRRRAARRGGGRARAGAQWRRARRARCRSRRRRNRPSRAGGRPRRRSTPLRASIAAAALVGRRDDHPCGAHREERPRAGELLRPVAVVRDEHHLVVGLAQHLLDAGGEARVELVAEIRDGDADDAARLMLQRPRRGVRDVAEPIGGGREPVARTRRDVAAAAERARGGGRRRARPRARCRRASPGARSARLRRRRLLCAIRGSWRARRARRPTLRRSAA